MSFDGDFPNCRNGGEKAVCRSNVELRLSRDYCIGSRRKVLPSFQHPRISLSDNLDPHFFFFFSLFFLFFLSSHRLESNKTAI